MILLERLRRMVRPQPLDWTAGAGRARAERPAAVDIIIPVYGAPDELRRCLESVAAHTDLATHGLLLVIDGPQGDAVESVLRDHGARARVLRNDARRGFAGSVNAGMRESVRDVVLLNSDTVVTARWIEKLIDAAYSNGDVGTVTPLSNDATLCSFPRPFVENLLPRGFDAGSFAELVESSTSRSYPRIPTGVGSCLYIRRALLKDIGFFDAERFPLGYGEENDFCFRALARGWLHVIDDATFIEHAAHASFGTSRERLLRRGQTTLRRLHPRYLATIARFMEHDPLAAMRQRVEQRWAPAASPKRRIVHLVHGWPPFQHAGTELYAAWLVRQQQPANHVAVYTRGADPSRADGDAVEWLDDGVRVRILTNHFTTRNPLRRNALRDRRMERDFERFLLDERPDLLHIHHLGGHVFSLAQVARRLGIPVVLQIQDWWFLCARVNQYDDRGRRCDGPSPEKCAQCVKLTRVTPAAATNRAMHALRRRMARAAIAAADVCIAGSRAIHNDYVRAGVIPATTPVHVIPYGVDLGEPLEPRSAMRRPVRFGYVGTLLPHKGVHTAVEAVAPFGADEAELHVWGNLTTSPEYVRSLQRLAGTARVVFEGTFREEEKANVFASMDVLLMPSIGLESFGLVGREAMLCGVPVVASAGAALSEMFEAGTCGEFFEAGNAQALRAILRRVVDDPAIIDQWAACLPRPKHSDEHAIEIERVYDTLRTQRS